MKCTGFELESDPLNLVSSTREGFVVEQEVICRHIGFISNISDARHGENILVLRVKL